MVSTHYVLVVGWTAVHFLDLLVGFANPVAAAEDAGSEAVVFVLDLVGVVVADSRAHCTLLPGNTGLAAGVCGPDLAVLISSTHSHLGSLLAAAHCPTLLAAGHNGHYSIAHCRPGHSRSRSRSIVAGHSGCHNSGIAAAVFAVVFLGRNIAAAAARNCRVVVDAP